MKFIPIVVMIAIILACENAPKSRREAVKLGVLEIPSVDKKEEEYSNILKKYHSNLINKTAEEKKKLWFEFISETMPQYWIGTDWDFNGVSREPQTGSIACGYLVTTILEDSGVKLNRVALAQAASSQMIQKLCKTVTIKRFNSIANMNNEIMKNGLDNDVYIVGLDFHTGFIIKTGEKLYFFHSDYISDQVVKEKVDESKNLKTSNTFMIGSLMQNENLFKNLN